VPLIACQIALYKSLILRSYSALVPTWCR